MADVVSKNFEKPDDVVEFPRIRSRIVELGDLTVGELAFEPGWRWSECVKQVAGTDSCQVLHVGVVQSGRLVVKHEDGTELELGPGDAYVIEPGHDAWVVGDERFVGFEFESRSAEEYAKS
ncbi:MAG: cupin domain-containing protein [Solirubrobacteraceae bacterium]